MKIKLSLLLPIACAMAMASLSADSYVHDSGLELHFQDGVATLQWYGAEGFTYFVQHTLELGEPWVYVPNLILRGEDDLLAMGYYSSPEAPQSFFKIQFSNIPSTDPEGDDFDGDGWSNLFEINANRDPLDFFNAQFPLLTLVSGNGQAHLPGEWLTYPWSVSVKNSEGVLLRNATDAVIFTSVSGDGQVSISDTGNDPLLATLTVATDAEGLAQAYVKLPVTLGAPVVVEASLSAHPEVPPIVFTATVGDPDLPPLAPTEVRLSHLLDDKMHVSWKDNSSNETAFYVQTSLDGETWATVGTVPANVTEFVDLQPPPEKHAIYRVVSHNEAP